MAHVVAPFTLDTFDQDPPYLEDGDVAYGRARISKTFRGALQATSTVEMLSVRAPGDSAGYVALEHVTGALDGRAGSFALLHIGTMVGTETWARWPVVPGSGSGELAGLTGEARIEIDAEGVHTLHLDYELG